MKILFLTPWYPDDQRPNHGNFVRNQALALNGSHEVVVISSKVNNNSFSVFAHNLEYSNFEGLPEYRIIVNRSLPILNQLVYFIISIWQSLRIARKFKPDIIHGNIGYPGAFWSWAVGKFLNRPVVVTEHTRIANNFRSAIHRFLTVFALKRVASVIGVSKWHAREVGDMISRDVNVIGNVIELDKFSIAEKSDQSKIQIGFLGGLHTPVKGLDILLRAIAPIKQDFVMHIGGDGKLLDTYKTLALQLGVDKKCVYYGFVAPTKVSDFLQQLDFFVCSSRWETFGMVVAEAMSCGLPVIVTDSAGISDFVVAENGIIVPKENAELLQAAIEQMIDKIKSYNRALIRQLALSNHSKEKFLIAIEEIYRRVVR